MQPLLFVPVPVPALRRTHLPHRNAPAAHDMNPVASAQSRSLFPNTGTPPAPVTALVGQPPTRREAVELLERCLQLSDDAALSTLRQGGLPLGSIGRTLLGLRA